MADGAAGGGRPRIGLTIGLDLKDRDYLRLRRTYTRAVVAAGGAPLLIPPTDDPDALAPVLEVLDGVIFPGGWDVEPAHYGQDRHPTTEVDEVLDRLELAVARWIAERSVPTLGICRGQQLLNVALGGSLVQDLPSTGVKGHRQTGRRDRLSHPLRVAPGSRLASIFDATELEVNSFHHQAVDRLAEGLRPVAWSPGDEVIEAFESTRHPWLLAVQFHPEDLVGSHAPSQRLFRAFVEACADAARVRV